MRLDLRFEIGAVEFDQDFTVFDVILGDHVALRNEIEDFGGDFDLTFHPIVLQSADFPALQHIDLQRAALHDERGHLFRRGSCAGHPPPDDNGQHAESYNEC